MWFIHIWYNNLFQSFVSLPRNNFVHFTLQYNTKIQWKYKRFLLKLKELHSMQNNSTKLVVNINNKYFPYVNKPNFRIYSKYEVTSKTWYWCAKKFMKFLFSNWNSTYTTPCKILYRFWTVINILNHFISKIKIQPNDKRATFPQVLNSLYRLIFVTFRGRISLCLSNLIISSEMNTVNLAVIVVEFTLITRKQLSLMWSTTTVFKSQTFSEYFV